MNKSYLLLAVLLASAAVLYTMDSPSANAETSQYMIYLSKFGKAVPNGDQLVYRSKIYAEFLKTMEKHNADSTQTWQMGVNQFSDLTKEEFVQTYLGEMNSEVREINQPVNAGFTVEVDWRTKGIVTKVKNQGQCGSCWAFGATASHESYQVQFKGQPNTIDLSEQQLVDCSTGSPYENNGCNGGYGVRALEYIKDNGQTTTDKYPYTAKNGACQTPTGAFRPFGVAEGHGCDEIEEIIVRRPLAVRVDASNWSPYKSGIFSNCAKAINHAVFMVGSSETAWTIKNSWGPTWGESGYIRLAKGDTCAVCQGPSFAI
jgi:C1A family cysteine protease